VAAVEVRAVRGRHRIRPLAGVRGAAGDDGTGHGRPGESSPDRDGTGHDRPGDRGSGHDGTGHGSTGQDGTGDGRSGHGGLRVITAAPAVPDGRDRAQAWLRSAMAALAVLAAAAAAVSWDAQYVMVRAVKHTPTIAALEAGVPDVGAVVFAALGIALALQGRRALRARALNLGCVGTSLAMNALASAPGWRDLAIWVMPSAVYALASDTLIGVIRAWVIGRLRHAGQVLAEDEATPMAVVGGLLLWLLRLALAPPSTISGFRGWVLEECPVAPGRTATRPAPGPRTLTGPPPAGPKPRPRPRGPRPQATRRPDGKQARMIALAAQRHDLTRLPLHHVSGIANTIGAEVDLSPGTARRVLLHHVRALQNGHPTEGGAK
jgi:hypothetical protein